MRFLHLDLLIWLRILRSTFRLFLEIRRCEQNECVTSIQSFLWVSDVLKAIYISVRKRGRIQSEEEAILTSWCR